MLYIQGTYSYYQITVSLTQCCQFITLSAVIFFCELYLYIDGSTNTHPIDIDVTDIKGIYRHKFLKMESALLGFLEFTNIIEIYILHNTENFNINKHIKY